MRLKGRIGISILVGIPLAVVAALVASKLGRQEADTDEEFLRRIEETRREAAPSEGHGLLAPDVGQGSEGPRPVISVKEEDLDFGTIPNTGPATIEVPIRNTGNAPLEIREVKPSCPKCVDIDLADGKYITVEPGGETTLKVTMKPAGIPGFKSVKTLTFMSNDPKEPMLAVTTRAVVEPEFELVPDAQEMDFGDVEKGSRPEREFVVRQLGEEPILVDEITKKADLNGVEFAFEKRPETEWESPNRPECVVRVALNTEEMSVGALKGIFYLGTTCKRVPWLPCTLKASVNSFFTATPSSFSLLRLKPGDTDLGEVTVKADRPIELRDLTVSAEDFLAVVKPGVSPNTAVIEVKVKKGAQIGKREEKVRFVVASDDKSVRHEIRIHGVLRGDKQDKEESVAHRHEEHAAPSE